MLCSKFTLKQKVLRLRWFKYSVHLFEVHFLSLTSYSYTYTIYTMQYIHTIYIICLSKVKDCSWHHTEFYFGSLPWGRWQPGSRLWEWATISPLLRRWYSSQPAWNQKHMYTNVVDIKLPYSVCILFIFKETLSMFYKLTLGRWTPALLRWRRAQSCSS